MDAQALATQRGWPQTEAMARLSAQEEIGRIIESIRVSDPDRFAGAWVDVATATLSIRTVGHVSDLGTINVPAPYKLLLDEGATVNEAALADEASRLSQIVSDSSAFTNVLGIGVDSRLQIIVVDVDSTDFDLAELRRLSRFRLEVRLEEGRVGNSNRGGIAMDGCTSAFGVRNSAGTRGLLTAGHCLNAQKYALTVSGTPTYGAPFKASLWNSTADMQWNTLNSHTATNTFFGSSSSAATTRSGTGTAYYGQLLCHRGKTTGYSCGYVTSTAYAPTWSNACNGTACNATFVRVDDIALANLPGDSGGPWFSGGYAYGVHMGGKFGEVAAWSVYTPITRISSLGVTLL